MTLVDSPTDRSWAAFSERAPWILDPDGLAWLPVTERLRTAARREVPQLTEPGRLPHMGRMAVVVFRLGRAVGGWWIRKRLGRLPDAEASRALR